MEIGNIIAVLGAVATFLFGMSTMTDGLEKLSSGRLEQILERLTNNVIKGVILGAVVTGLISATVIFHTYHELRSAHGPATSST